MEEDSTNHMSGLGQKQQPPSAQCPKSQDAFDFIILPVDWCNDLDCYALCGNLKKVIPSVSCKVDAVRSFLTLSLLLPAVDRISSSVSCKAPLLRRARAFVSEHLVHFWSADGHTAMQAAHDGHLDDEPQLLPIEAFDKIKSASSLVLRFVGDPAESTTASISAAKSEIDYCDDSHCGLQLSSPSEGNAGGSHQQPMKVTGGTDRWGGSVRVRISSSNSNGAPNKGEGRCTSSTGAGEPRLFSTAEWSLPALLGNLPRLEGTADASSIMASLSTAFTSVLRILWDPLHLPSLPMCATRCHPGGVRRRGRRYRSKKGVRGTRGLQGTPTALLDGNAQRGERRGCSVEFSGLDNDVCSLPSCVSFDTADVESVLWSSDADSTGTSAHSGGHQLGERCWNGFAKQAASSCAMDTCEGSASFKGPRKEYYTAQHEHCHSSSSSCSSVLRSGVLRSGPDAGGGSSTRRRSWSTFRDELNTCRLAMRLFIDDTTIPTNVRRTAATIPRPIHYYNGTDSAGLKLVTISGPSPSVVAWRPPNNVAPPPAVCRRRRRNGDYADDYTRTATAKQQHVGEHLQRPRGSKYNDALFDAMLLHPTALTSLESLQAATDEQQRAVRCGYTVEASPTEQQQQQQYSMLLPQPPAAPQTLKRRPAGKRLVVNLGDLRTTGAPTGTRGGGGQSRAHRMGAKTGTCKRSAHRDRTRRAAHTGRPKRKFNGWMDSYCAASTTGQCAMLLLELAVCRARQVLSGINHPALEVSLPPIKKWAVVCSEFLYDSVRRAVGLCHAQALYGRQQQQRRPPKRTTNNLNPNHLQQSA